MYHVCLGTGNFKCLISMCLIATCKLNGGVKVLILQNVTSSQHHVILHSVLSTGWECDIFIYLFSNLYML